MVQVLSSIAAAPTADPSAPAEPVRYVDPSVVGPGLVGFVLFIGLAFAVFLLWRSMNKQLNRIDFEEDGAPRPVNAPFTTENAPQDSGTGAKAATKGPGTD